jgi:hypothetical protein
VALQTGFDADVRMMPGQRTDEIQLIQFNLDKKERFNVKLPFTIDCTDIQQRLIDEKANIDVTNTLDWRTWDRNRSGDNRDDYMVKVGDKHAVDITIMVDGARQNAVPFGFSMPHAARGSDKFSGWVNELKGDGHVVSVRARAASWDANVKFINTNPSADEFQPGWGNSGAPVCW